MACTSRIVDLNQNQNSTIICQFTVVDSSGDSVDMTGVVFTFTGKEDADDADSEAAWQVSVTASGTDTIDLSASTDGLDVGTYRYDIVADDGDVNEVYENLSIVIKQRVGD